MIPIDSIGSSEPLGTPCTAPIAVACTRLIGTGRGAVKRPLHESLSDKGFPSERRDADPDYGAVREAAALLRSRTCKNFHLPSRA